MFSLILLLEIFDEIRSISFTIESLFKIVIETLLFRHCHWNWKKIFSYSDWPRFRMEVVIELLENKKKFLVFERKVAWNIILVKNFWSILFARGKSINARSNKLFQYLAWFSIKTYIYSFLSSFLSFLLFFNTNTEFKWNFLLLFSQNDKKNIYIMNDIFRRNCEFHQDKKKVQSACLRDFCFFKL